MEFKLYVNMDQGADPNPTGGQASQLKTQLADITGVPSERM